MSRGLTDFQQESIRDSVNLMFSNSNIYSTRFTGEGVVHRDKVGLGYARPMGYTEVEWKYVVSVCEPDKTQWYIERIRVLDPGNDPIMPRHIEQGSLDKFAYDLSLRWPQSEIGFEIEDDPRPTYSKVSYVSVPSERGPKIEDEPLVRDGVIEIIGPKVVIDTTRLTGKLRRRSKEILEKIASISGSVAQYYGHYGGLRLDITPGQANLTAQENFILTDPKTVAGDVSYTIAALSNLVLANRQPSVGHTGYERRRSPSQAEIQDRVAYIEPARKSGDFDLPEPRAALEG